MRTIVLRFWFDFDFIRVSHALSETRFRLHNIIREFPATSLANKLRWVDSTRRLKNDRVAFYLRSNIGQVEQFAMAFHFRF